MNKLKDFHKDDQLYYIESFVTKCKNILNKFNKNQNEESSTKNVDSIIFNQLFK